MFRRVRALLAFPGKVAESVRQVRRNAPWRKRTDLLVFGSSVLWGQGHQEASKLDVLFARWLEKTRREKVTLQRFAHSGAHLQAPGEAAALFGEVPTPHPTVEQQVAMAPARGRGKTRILIEGGINEVGGGRIVNPRTRASEIRQLTKQSCYHSLKEVLRQVAAKYPYAEVLVPGYYHIVAPAAGMAEVASLLAVEGVSGKPADDDDSAADSVVRNSQHFAVAADHWMGRAVAEVRAETELDCRFVPSGFSMENGMFGRDCFLFQPWQIDPMMDERAGPCARALSDGRTGVHCFLAAAFHPNERGVAQYLKALQRSYEGRGGAM